MKENITGIDFPWGKYKYEVTYRKNNLNVIMTEYEKRLSISIIEINRDGIKTLFSNYFLNRAEVKLIIDQGLLNDEEDDIIFHLTRLKETEE
jgi:hypothetical protein